MQSYCTVKDAAWHVVSTRQIAAIALITATLSRRATGSGAAQAAALGALPSLVRAHPGALPRLHVCLWGGGNPVWVMHPKTTDQ